MIKRTNSRKQKAQEMRQKIQDAAQRLFEIYGYDNVSMEDIAAEVGCSTGNVYYHYKTKDALAVALSNRVDSAYRELQEMYYQNQSMSALEKLVDFIERSLLISTEDQLINYSMAYNLKYSKEMDLAYEYMFSETLNNLIVDCQGEGSIPEEFSREDLARGFKVIHRGLLVEYSYSGKNFDVAEFGKYLSEIFVSGIQNFKG